MANYVWNYVICSKEAAEKYFIDYTPFGKDNILDDPYITFNKLFDMDTIDDYEDKIGVPISYGWGFSYNKLNDNTYELKFTTRWEYPIKPIIKIIELYHDTIWYAVEENHIYISKFYWSNGVKEDVIFILDEFHDQIWAHQKLEDSLEDWDDPAWYFMPYSTQKWINWESPDYFKRYLDTPVCDVKDPFK